MQRIIGFSFYSKDKITNILCHIRTLKSAMRHGISKGFVAFDMWYLDKRGRRKTRRYIKV